MKMTCFTALKFNPQCDIRPLLSTPSRLLSQYRILTTLKDVAIVTVFKKSLRI